MAPPTSTSRRLSDIMKVLGIDPSTKTGWVLLGSEAPRSGEISITAKGFRRVVGVQQNVRSLLWTYSPDLVVIEGYAYGNRHTLVTLVEIGTAIRLMLHEYAIKQMKPWIDLPPTVLKKYVTGKGTSPKKDVMVAVQEQWGFTGTDNECDAFGLAMFGMTMLDAGRSPPNDRSKFVAEWLGQNTHIADRVRLYARV
jgi:crossover junction endodeoxyribonuclease RuvC